MVLALRAEPAAAALYFFVTRVRVVRVVHRGAAETDRGVPVIDPFPDIAGHFLEALAIRGNCLTGPRWPNPSRTRSWWEKLPCQRLA